MSDRHDLRDYGDEIWVYKFDEEASHKFRLQMRMKSKEDPRKPIVIYIDSYGGNVDGMAKMIDTMDEIPNPKITVCFGKAMSAGAILLSHGDIRFCAKSSRVMIHELSAGALGNVREIKNTAEELFRVNELWMGLLAKNCCIKDGYKGLQALIRDNNNQDIYLSAEDARKFGIIDYIGLPDLAEASLFEVTKAKCHRGEHITVEEAEKKRKKKKKVTKKKATVKKVTKKKKTTKKIKGELEGVVDERTN